MKKYKTGFLFGGHWYKIGEYISYTAGDDDLIDFFDAAKQIKPEYLSDPKYDFERVLEIEQKSKSRKIINIFTLKEIMRQYKLSQL
jgi:hypothetical protein